ncbi:hypothetical protein L1987_27282 [Smallanthus sonchifolius]|uniref:Uncharacterized protein n=1 Tax=Smallanthus sonchifolius TaxID=185202 RepID=A0ACB9ICG3_9ASTR|nr:hypothetical protein L1987_27282 [Smallanthus sonchifolius]
MWVENFELGVTNLTPEFLKMNPIGKIPVLETPDGFVFESNAIDRYVARLKTDTSLFGSSPIEYIVIIKHSFTLRVEEAAIVDLKRALGALNTYLATHNFLVGDDVTLADIIMTCNLYAGFKVMMTKTFTSEFPHVESGIYFSTYHRQKISLSVVTQLDSIKGQSNYAILFFSNRGFRSATSNVLSETTWEPECTSMIQTLIDGKERIPGRLPK